MLEEYLNKVNCKKLENKGITKPLQLLQILPKSYYNWNEAIKSVYDLGEINKPVFTSIKLMVKDIFSYTKCVKLECYDEKNEKIILTSYSKYQMSCIKIGKWTYFKGYISYDSTWGLQMIISDINMCDTNYEPVYASLYCTNKNAIRNAIISILRNNPPKEYLSKRELEIYNLMKREQAYCVLHQVPQKGIDINYEKYYDDAYRRYAFDVLVNYVYKINENNKVQQKSEALSFDNTRMKLWNKVTASLPFELTNSQKEAIETIKTSLQNNYLNALVQGDVGSGKTMIVVFVAAFVLDNNYQCAIAAPTEILAKQHYEEFSGYFGNKVVFLGSSTKAKEKKEINRRLSSGESMVVIGTHSVFQASVEFKNLAIVVIDEQHKFGVEQRNALLKNSNIYPHVITMSATPIPRTLAETSYGTNICVINIKKPATRLPVITESIISDEIGYEKIYEEVKKGHQAYIICALINTSDSEKMSDVQSVNDEYERCKLYFEGKNISIGYINGKMKKDEIEDIRENFKNGIYDILISTTVVEVGVNVPNATVIMIKNSEQFGLATLHQLRGRVGRGKDQAYCLLQSEKKSERDKIMCSTNDGYKIAIEDMRLRGPGNILGTQQSGYNREIALITQFPQEYKNAKCYIKDFMEKRK